MSRLQAESFDNISISRKSEGPRRCRLPYSVCTAGSASRPESRVLASPAGKLLRCNAHSRCFRLGASLWQPEQIAMSLRREIEAAALEVNIATSTNLMRLCWLHVDFMEPQSFLTDRKQPLLASLPSRRSGTRTRATGDIHLMGHQNTGRVGRAAPKEH